MLEIRKQLAPSTSLDVIDHLNKNLAPHLSQDVSNYAKGRKRVWLEYEAPLSNSQAFKPATHNSKLWKWLKEVASKSGMPVPQLGLAVYGDTGIQLHRDASYANPLALSINLGKVEFLFDDNRQGKTNKNIRQHNLDSGEIILFDCKHRHAAINPNRNRWSIILWTIAPKFTKLFHQLHIK